jgi:hypothetical protein
VRDALRCVVHGHRKLIRPTSVGASQHEVAAFLRQVEALPPQEAIFKLDRSVFHAQSIRTRRLALQSIAASSRIGTAAGLRACASAREREPPFAQPLQSRSIDLASFALIYHWPVPLKSVGFERSQDIASGAGHRAGLIDVFDSHEPFAALGARIQITRGGRNERAKV